jgi:heme exporter protein D
VGSLYIWSAVIGLLLGLVLIVVAQVMQTGRLH